VLEQRLVSNGPLDEPWGLVVAPAGFGQVGCVYTAQGFEYDWSGVIIGPDLVVRHGRAITVRQANKDPEFKKRSVSDRSSWRVLTWAA